MDDQQIAAARKTTVYSVEFKLAKVAEFEGSGMSRAEFARKEGITPSTFDGWVWKSKGLRRGHAKADGAALAPAPIDVTSAVRGSPAPTSPAVASVTVNGFRIEAGPDGMAMLLEAMRGC